MKIAFIVGQFPLLSETFIINQITGLRDRGHDVDIYADQPGDLTKLHDDVINYNLLDHTTYFSKIPNNLVWRAMEGSNILITKLFQNPAKTLEAINVFKHGKSALSLWLLYSLVPQLKQEYDIILCQFGTAGFRGMAFQKMHSPQAKLITIFRGRDISNFVKERGENVYNPLFQRGDYFLANCDFFKKRVLQLGCPADKIKVHGSGLDCQRFPFQTRDFPADNLIRIATTGRLVEKKGIEYSIRAVAQVQKQYPNLEYTIVGEGELRPHFEQLIQKLNATKTIKLIGQKSHKEIIEILTQSHLFIAPSVTAQDGDQDAPINVLKEAMATGLPVISTTHGGIPELVEDNVSGFLVPERDADAIAQKLIYLIEHPERWPEMGQAGRNCVEAHYDLNRLNDALVHLYQSLLSLNSKSASETIFSATTS
jgi:colanic acid/amylovoran biosynthesis glycosyltransferase